MGSVVVNIVVLLWTVGPLLAGPMILFLAASVYYQRKLMKTKREVVRLEAISRSPMMTCVAGLVRGAPEIRILKKQRYVTEEFIDRLEDNIKNNILMYGLDAWYMNTI